MSIRAKSLLIIGTTIVALALAINWFARGFLLERFRGLGVQFAREDAERLVNAVGKESADLQSTAWDWSAWDATYAFVQDGNPAYIAENLVDDTFTTLSLDLLAIVRNDGAVVWGRSFDFEAKRMKPLPAGLAEYLGKGQPLMTHHDESSVTAGLIRLDGVAVMVCARPIVTSGNEGPIAGVLIMGRILDAAHIDRLGRLTGVAATVLPPDAPEVPRDSSSIVIRTRDENTLEGYCLLRSLGGEPCLALRILVPRRIYQTAELSVAYFVLMLLLANLIIGLTGFVVLERYVIRRLTALNRDVKAMNAAGSGTARLREGQADEVGSLAAEFNRLLDKLERYAAAQRQINEDLDRRVAERTQALRESRGEIRRLYRHMEEVREVERRRVAERVHDELGQSLTALKMTVEGAKAGGSGGPGAADARLADMVALIEEMTATMQDIAMELRPSMLDHFGLLAAVQWAVRKFTERSGIECQLDADEFPSGDSKAALTVFRIVQELLTNVARHAAATVVFVRLRLAGGRLRVDVEDNGRGITQQELSSPEAFGLTMVRERAASLGGEFEIGADEEGGTRASVSIPWTGPVAG